MKKPLDTRTRVLDAALALYQREGQQGFNVHAIVAESGSSLGSIYHHFGSMDGLAAALYARSMAGLLDRVAVAVSRARSLKGGVTALVGAYLEYARSERTAMLFIHASSYASFLPAHAALIEESKGGRLLSIREFFAVRVASGEIDAIPLPVLEVLLLGPVSELTRRHLAGDASIDLAEAARILPARILAAITTSVSAR